jgi:DNA-binding NtrC family response regulator
MNNQQLRALLVDDDPEFIDDFRILLPADIKCIPAQSVDEADRHLEAAHIDIVFLDINLGTGDSGLDYLKRLKRDNPYLPVIMISADQNVPTVVKAMQLGASYYVNKSPDLNGLKIAVSRAIEESRLRQKYALLESELNSLIGDLVGESDAMRRIKDEMKRLASVMSNVLITGQSGTGKELVARGIHRLSPQYNQPFIAVNCPALSRELIESELFGHEQGAFTGAVSRRIGKCEQVGGGTLFLDEITEIPVEIQAKLLRVLQERNFERVGGNRLFSFRGRVLASTNRDIDQAVADGKLREDLLYRLNVTRIHLPPLTERRDDIPLLVNHFVRLKAMEMKKPVPRVSEDAMRALQLCQWPGNVRELGNCIESVIVYCDSDVIDTHDLERCVLNGFVADTSYEDAKKHYLAKFQRNFLAAALKRNDDNLTKTADDIGVTRQGLAKMLKACGLGDSYADDNSLDQPG